MSNLKVQICSDIHTEFHSDQGRKLLQRIAKDTSKEVQAILIPGDLSTNSGLRYAFSILCDSFENVIYTTGNHEYYKSSKQKTHDIIRECCDKYSNLHWLNRSHVIINEQRFIGCTLWFPPLSSVLNNLNYTNDCKLIQSDRSQHDELPHWILEEFDKNNDYLQNNVQEGDFVLTHYIPCPEGIHPSWRNAGGNQFFMGDVSDVIKNNNPKIWVHGHTHEFMNYNVAQTEFHCNPCGYPHELSFKKFNDSYVIEF